ncbi:hypothetical protein ACH4RA_31955 [Streptomyces smyrnaeus]|uniref:hypothetical protein n=1 Tax=Streptomyces TaxID=1883 RepID=UPI000C193166|nr:MULTISPECIES: hypothetical protein [unclassified Streptomyces]MBQ0868088.1 hypothetical protein [Streptomyces sp. RK75]MBQ1121740.1 hypothetical protein [Streptomyces sp. B15]MBQ1162240.1 hypothetical protein [Streptomyces sp. A73]
MRTTLWALEGLEHLFFGNGQRVARRNAWTAVLEDRRRARARREAETVLNAASDRRPPRLTSQG